MWYNLIGVTVWYIRGLYQVDDNKLVSLYFYPFPLIKFLSWGCSFYIKQGVPSPSHITSFIWLKFHKKITCPKPLTWSRTDRHWKDRQMNKKMDAQTENPIARHKNIPFIEDASEDYYYFFCSCFMFYMLYMLYSNIASEQLFKI